MNSELLVLTEQIKDAYEGKPWFGRSVKEILSEIDESVVFEKPKGQHSILELVWHMITWKEFTISCIRKNNQGLLKNIEEKDWRKLDHSDKSLWQSGLQRLDEIHNELLDVIQQQTDDLLLQQVSEKEYNFRKLLYGVCEHDIYHLGQIAYIKKMLQK